MVRERTMQRRAKPAVRDFNQHITCKLCKGYFVDATTIIECLHSFCRSCIVKYLAKNKYCPVCDVQVHKTKPLLNIRSDTILQDVVYKLVPKLLQSEVRRRQQFTVEHPEAKPPELFAYYQHILLPDESISITLSYQNCRQQSTLRYLRCPAAVSMTHLQKLIRAKYGLSECHRVDIYFSSDERLDAHITLMDIAYIYAWKRKEPIELTYRIYEFSKVRGGKVASLQESVESANNNWKEVQLRISENGEMSITGIQDDVNNDNNNYKSGVGKEEKESAAEVAPSVDVTVAPPIDVKAAARSMVDSKAAPSSDMKAAPSMDVKAATPSLDTKAAPPKTAPAIVKPRSTTPNILRVSKAKNRVVKATPPVMEPKTNMPPSGKIKSAKPTAAPSTKPHASPSGKRNASQSGKANAAPSVGQSNVALSIGQSSAAPLIGQSSTAPSNDAAENETKFVSINSDQAKDKQPTKRKATANDPEDIALAPPVKKPSVQHLSNNHPLKKHSVQTDQSRLDETSFPRPPAPSGSPLLNRNFTPISSRPGTPITTTNATKPAAKLCYTPKPAVINIPKPSTSSSTSPKQPVTNNNDKSAMAEKQMKPIPNLAALNTMGKFKAKPSTPMGYKTLRDPPKSWNSQIAKAKVSPDSKGEVAKQQLQLQNQPQLQQNQRPAKFFKMRNNMPRYLGNPASGVKPMYQVQNSDAKNATAAPSTATPPPIFPKQEIKKHSIVKIDPKTLKPISEKAPEMTSLSSTTAAPSTMNDLKINTSSVSIFNPLKLNSPNSRDRKSPHSPNKKSSSGHGAAALSPPAKRDKPSLNFTPPNPFVPNLASPTLNPNQLVFPGAPPPGFLHYDPSLMVAYHRLLCGQRGFPPIGGVGGAASVAGLTQRKTGFEFPPPLPPPPSNVNINLRGQQQQQHHQAVSGGTKMQHSPRQQQQKHDQQQGSRGGATTTQTTATNETGFKSTNPSSPNKKSARENAKNNEKSLEKTVEKLTHAQENKSESTSTTSCSTTSQGGAAEAAPTKPVDDDNTDTTCKKEQLNEEISKSSDTVKTKDVEERKCSKVEPEDVKVEETETSKPETVEVTKTKEEPITEIVKPEEVKSAEKAVMESKKESASTLDEDKNKNGEVSLDDDKQTTDSRSIDTTDNDKKVPDNENN